MLKGKKIKIALRILLSFILLVAAYYTIEVLYARSITVQKADEYYKNGTVEIKLTELTARQKEILIKVQDPNFYNHNGVEFSTPGSGVTTITQSLAKKFYFKDFKQGIRKIKQTLCAVFALDPLIEKDKQLELFINISYLGNDIVGIKDAAKFYFGKEVNELTEDEYISLIASLVSPVDLNIKDNPDGNKERVERIKKVLSGEYKPNGLLDIMYDKESQQK